ncbi:sensor histidine kinase [Brevundimonas lenta]|uniref:histidine kinase n=1 Tax=Brevundimonas lenta TaxID=424796 RepID=A0A7W6JEF9_9CAUL|nr:sensor histidine kinase [Brevundimonas lenta]MBB4083624.1 two-component sensor histidine kinase [Brevundimonas lenta]
MTKPEDADCPVCTGPKAAEGRPVEPQLRRKIADLERALEQCKARPDEVDPREDRWALKVREVDHRAKNSLQLAASMLMMQARSIDDLEVRDHLEAASERLQTFARLHAVLHEGTDHDGVLVRPWLEQVCKDLRMAPDVEIAVEAPDETWPAELARPIGLFIFEAVTNALKHAFPESGAGHIEVSLRRTPPFWRVEVADDGSGPPAASRSGLGTALFPIFADQLDGELMIARGLDDRGMRVGIVFAEPDGLKRAARTML